MLNFKIKDDLSINCKDGETLCIEHLFENKRNTLINVLYRPPNGQTESFEIFLKNVFSITKISNKVHHIEGDFNLNLLDHENSRKVQGFLNLIYQNYDTDYKQTYSSNKKNVDSYRSYTHQQFYRHNHQNRYH